METVSCVAPAVSVSRCVTVDGRFPGTPVARETIQAGDLVFFDANGPGASHVGIATSNTTAISATSHGVREHATTGSYWGSHYYGARRVG